MLLKSEAQTRERERESKPLRGFAKFLFLFFVFAFCFFQTTSPVFATTLLSDDFTGTTIDTNKWVVADTSGTNVSQNNQLSVTGSNAWNANGVRTVSNYDRSTSDLTVEADVTFSNCAATTASIVYGPWQGSLATGTIIFNRIDNAFKIWSFSTSVVVSGVTCQNGVPVHVKVVIKSAGGVDVYLNSNPTPNGSLNSIQAPNTFTNYPISLQQYDSGSTLTFDNLTISDSVSVPTAPSAPTGLGATSGNTQASLSWTAPNNGGSAITDYVVEYKETSGSTWTTFSDGTSTNTTATVTGLTNGTSYDFRVSATNAIGTGSPSSTASTTPNPSAPDPPTTLYGTPANGQISLTWVAPASNGGSAITDYIIEHRIGSSDWTTFADGTSTNATTIVTGLVNGTTYELRVSAVNIIGTGSTSGTTFVTAGILGMADTFTGTDFDLSKWTESDSAVGGANGAAGNVQQNGGLTVTGNNNWGTNGLQSVPTFDRTNGNVSVQVTMSGTSCSSGNLFEFGYGDLDFLTTGTGYIVTNNAGSWLLYYWLNGSNQGSVSITGVSCTANIPLTMKLVVLQAGGAKVYVNGSTTESATQSGGTFTNKPVWLQNYSSGVTTTFDNLYVIKPASPPEAPTSLTATAGNGQVALSWTAPNDNGSAITDYVIEYRNGSGAYSTFSDGTSTATSTSVTGLTNGLTYTFRVSATNANGTSVVSGTTTGIPITSVATAPSASSVSISGTAAVDEILTGSYTFVDPNGDSEGTSTFRWLRADSSDGTYSAISGATSTTYTVTSFDLNKYIKFEVIPVSSTVPTNGTAVLSSATSQISAALDYLNHLLSTGQSLATGTNGAPALTTTQPYSNVMLSGASLVPLVESSVETMSSAMANSITAKVAGNTYQVAVTRHGQGGTAYSGLKKGTTPYSNGMTQVSLAKAAAEAQGKTYRVTGVTTIHGESDHLAGNGAFYEGYLVEWQHDYETDVEAVTGQTGTTPLFTDQMSSHTGYSAATSTIPIAQLSAAENNSGKIILVGPKYFLNYSDSAHLTNSSYRWLGEYYGKVIKKVVVDKQTWTPLSPRQVVRNSNIIYARLYVPVTPIVFDTTIVQEKTNYGFEYTDDSSSASISTVEILDNETVKITLNTTPTGANQKLRYAYTGTPGAQPGAQIAGSAHGNLRDSDSTTSLYGNTLYNWLVHFDKTISSDTTAPTNSSVTPTTNSSSATITWMTNESGSSIVDYGLTDSYGNSTTETDTPTRVTSHSKSLSNLQACVTYHYRVRSSDLAQNEGTGVDGTFTTLGCMGSATVDSQTSSQITTASGGSVNLLTDSKGITLTVPVSFAGSDANFQIKQLDKTSVINTTSTPTGYSLINSYLYDLQALSGVSTAITTFDNPLTVTMTYGASDVSGIDESTLKIYRWDGSAWNLLTGCTITTSTKTVSCTTTHFSVFGLFGQATTTTTSTSTSSSSNSNSSTSAPSCNDTPPGSKAPWLYGAIAQDSGSVLLYFTEADNPVNKYVLEYGTKSGNYPYGVQDMGVNSRGQMTFLVKSLLPNTTYYFKVRGGNGCATGSWSNEISAKTKGLVSFNQLEITQSELEAQPVIEIPSNTSCQTYTVKSGDTLWSIAKILLRDGNKYKEIIEQNKDTYSSLETSNNLRSGWELKINCGTQQQTEENKTPETITQKGYDVKVKVVDTNKNPIEGAKVTIHSKVQETTTNKDGIAEFKNVEAGDHKVLIAYNNYEGEQSVNLTGDVKEFDLNVTVQQKAISLSPLAYGIIGIMGIIIIGLIVLLIKSKRKE